MRTLTYYIGSSVDGFIAAQDGSVDAFPVTEDVLQHIASEYPETLPTHVHDALGADPRNGRFDTVVMGRVTYEPALKEGITSPYAHLKQYVVSRSLTTSPDPAVHIVRDDPVRAVQQLKRQGGKGIWLAGGAKLASALVGEIDELVVKLYPFAFGSGVPIFANGFQPIPLELTGNRVLDGGAAVLTYAKR